MKKCVFMLIIVLLLASCAVNRKDETVNSSNELSVTESSVSESSEVVSFEESGYVSFECSEISNSFSDTSDVTIVEKEVLDFKYQTIYTDKLRKDGIYPYYNYYNSSEAFDKSKKENNDMKIYVTDKAVGDIPSYNDWVEKYDEAFFEGNGLIVAVVEGNANALPEIERVYKQGDRIEIYFTDAERIENESQVYHIFIKVCKSDMPKQPLTDIHIQ